MAGGGGGGGGGWLVDQTPEINTNLLKPPVSLLRLMQLQDYTKIYLRESVGCIYTTEETNRFPALIYTTEETNIPNYYNYWSITLQD